MEKDDWQEVPSHDADDWQDLPTSDSAATSPVTAATTSLAEGALPFGLAGTLAGAGKAGMDAITGVRGPLAGGSLQDIASDYQQAKNSFQNDAERSAKENPKIALATQIAPVAGAAGYGLAKGAASVGGKLLASEAVKNYLKGKSGEIGGRVGSMAGNVVLPGIGGDIGSLIGARVGKGAGSMMEKISEKIAERKALQEVLEAAAKKPRIDPFRVRKSWEDAG
jgi:hypothetical protein